MSSERPFSADLAGRSDPIMAGLKAAPRPIEGRCGACAYFAICGGNTRVRALQLTGDPWAEDPACYLTDAEIGVAGGPRLTSRPAAARAMIRRIATLSLALLAAARGRRRTGRGALRRALRLLPRRRPPRRHGPALLPENLGRLRKPDAAERDRAWPRRDADAGLRGDR